MDNFVHNGSSRVRKLAIWKAAKRDRFTKMDKSSVSWRLRPYWKIRYYPSAKNFADGEKLEPTKPIDGSHSSGNKRCPKPLKNLAKRYAEVMFGRLIYTTRNTLRILVVLSAVFWVIQAGKHILSRFWYLLFLCAILEQRRCCLVHASRKSRNVIIVVIASVREKVKAETICQADGKWLEQANRSWDKGGIRLWIQRKIALLCQCLWR